MNERIVVYKCDDGECLEGREYVAWVLMGVLQLDPPFYASTHLEAKGKAWKWRLETFGDRNKADRLAKKKENEK